MQFITAKELAQQILSLPDDVQNMPIALQDEFHYLGIIKNMPAQPTCLQVKTLDHTGWEAYPSKMYSEKQRAAFKSVLVLEGYKCNLV